MAVSNVALTNTFDQWRLVTNQLAVIANDILGDGLSTYRNLTANVVTANVVTISTMNVESTIIAAFNAANSAGSSASANAAFDQANAAFTQANATFDQANAAFTQANSVYLPSVTRLSVTNSGSSAYLIDQYSGNNPEIFISSGETIAFNLNVTGHPFMIRQSSGGSNYNTGLTHVATNGTVSTNSAAQGQVTGTLYWKVPFELSSNIYVYQCSVHSGMVGFIKIRHPGGKSSGLITTLTDAATITPDFSSNNNFKVTLGGNRTLANATNTTVGQSGVIYLIQDGTGSRTVSFGLAYKFVDNSAPTLTTTANAVDAIVYSVRTANSYVCNALLNVGNSNDT